MKSITAGDYGYTLRVPLEPVADPIDLRTATRIDLHIGLPGTQISLTMAAGTTAIVEDGATYAPGQWAFRDILSGDIPAPFAGISTVTLVYIDADSHITSLPVKLTIASAVA